MACAEGERLPTAAELLLLQEMEHARTDWENPMHEWVNLVAAFRSKNPWRIARSIKLAKTSPWTHQALDKQLESALGRSMLCEENAEPDEVQQAYDLEEKQNFLDEQKQRAHDAKQWENLQKALGHDQFEVGLVDEAPSDDIEGSDDHLFGE